MKSTQMMYDNLIATGVKPEDARYVLPNATLTNLIISFNLRSFINFYSKRNKETHAQWEIAELAEMLMAAVVIKEPWVKEILKQK